MTRLHQAGFTLIELMVAITLGLLITAAAIQLYLTSVTSFNVQKAMANIQDSASFGVNYILDDVRKANLSASSAYINDQQANAGLLLTASNVSDQVSGKYLLTLAETALTKSAVGDSNVDQKSDQLTIRYQATQSDYDCTGKTLVAGTYVAQRYFVGSDKALRCVADQYMRNGNTITAVDGKPKTTLDLSGVGQIIIPSVDYMRIKVGYVKGALNNPTALNYVSVADYLDTVKTPTMTKNIDGISQQIKPYINVIQIGLLVQSNETAGNDVNVRNRNKKTFDVLGQSVALNSTNQDTRLRQVVTQTISLRNAMGWVEEGYVTQ
ncbi:PilW family protein [Acinetobacter soli]|uniref:Prepilin-type N-terminal cleavage/methylation domain-containing protein n=1 Tax=Acinetobacter soli TaxID=487316 RepID=A0A1P8EK83_9GAMM|nr:PilW family protein [Acinetobacter soli]APV36626.1 prepilin-type N-terminal cleavage/methylation domain-containing protein [Acinetobacter soli]